MIINIRYMKRVDEGTLIYALVPKVQRPPFPHHEVGDTDEVREKKRTVWDDALKIYNVEDREVKLLHLGIAKLTQDDKDEE